MTVEDVDACQFSAWYPAFKDVAFTSRMLELPADFIAYLVQDGVFLPEDSKAVSID